MNIFFIKCLQPEWSINCLLLVKEHAKGERPHWGPETQSGFEEVVKYICECNMGDNQKKKSLLVASDFVYEWSKIGVSGTNKAEWNRSESNDLWAHFSCNRTGHEVTPVVINLAVGDKYTSLFPAENLTDWFTDYIVLKSAS